MSGRGIGHREDGAIPGRLPLHRAHRPPVPQVAPGHQESGRKTRPVGHLPTAARFRHPLPKGSPEPGG
jgi:hypothetical protein